MSTYVCYRKLLPSSSSRTAPITHSCTAIYILNGFPAFGACNMDGDTRYSLIFSKAYCYSAPPQSELLLMFESNQWQQRLHSSCKVRYKTTQVIYLTEQLLDVFLAHRFSNLLDGLNFLGVDLYAMLIYYKPQEPSRCYPEGALQLVHLQSILLHPFQCQF
jgi:hypothetical protein